MHRRCILIVEDDGILAVDLMETLKGLKYRVLEPVSTGSAAVEAAGRERPDLVLMDIDLPGGMSGIKAAELIHDLADIPVIFLTGYSQEPLIRKARDTAPYGYLVKPVPERELAATIEIALHRHSLDRKLKESEERYRVLVENANEAIVVIRDGVLLFVNPRTMELSGYAREELLMMHFGSLIHPEDRDMVLGRHEQRMRGEAVPTGYMFRVMRKDGTYRWAQINAVPIIWEGAPATINILNDITDRVEAEEALRKSENLFRTIFEHAPFGIALLDKGGQPFLTNDAVHRMLGYSGLEIAHMDFPDFTHPGDREESRRLFQELMAGDRDMYTLEKRYLHKNGSLVWTNMAAFPLRDKEGRPESVIGMTADITGLKKTEQALRESELLFRSLVDAMIDPVIILGFDGFSRFANNAAARLAGVPVPAPGDHVDIRPFLDAESAERAFRDLEIVCREGGPVTGEYAIYTTSGEVRWVEALGVRIPYQGTEADLVSMRDITLRRKAEQDLRESEKQYRQLVEALQEGIWTIDRKGVTTFVNPRMAEMLGYTQEEMLGRHLFEFMDARWAEIAKNRIGNRAPALSGHREFEFLRKDGSRLYTTLAAAPLEDRDGRYAGLLAGIIDISDRRLMEEELKLSRANLAALIESTDDLIWSVDTEFRMITFNSSFDRYIREQYGTRARVGEKPEDRVTRDKAVEWRELYSRALEQGRFRTEIAVDDGRVLEFFLNPIRSEGEITGISAFARDVTERRRFEEERMSFERQLIQAQKMEAIGSLAGGIAHDFNNILSTIIGNAEMSLEEDTIDTIHYSLRQILSGSVRARDLVRQILTFSRPRKQEQKVMDLKDIITEGAKLLKATLPPTIGITTKIAKGEHLVYGDPSQVHQVVINLCTNAGHAMARKGGKLDLSIRNVTVGRDDTQGTVDLADGQYVKLSVSDTGHGIEPGILDKIFDPFFTTKGPGEGTGLGLAVVYGIVRSHGGAITVETDQGKGSVFNVFLPLSQRGREEAEFVPAGGLGGRERVLFVDDEPQIVEIVKKALGALGYDLTVCGNPLQALKLFKKDPERFDLVITDLSMPNMTGKDLARALHKLRPGVPVILSTGHNELVGEEDLGKFGIRELLMKPVSLREYALAVRRVLDGKA